MPTPTTPHPLNSSLPPWYLMHSKTPSPSLAPSHLLRHTLVGVEAVGKLLAMLVARVVRQHLLARGALEGLEAGFALDCLGCGVLSCQFVSTCDFSPDNWRVFGCGGLTDLICDFASLGPLSPLRSRFCCALCNVLDVPLYAPRQVECEDGVLGSVTHGEGCVWLTDQLLVVSSEAGVW